MAAISQEGGGERAKVYFFKGKPYYSLGAYQHAIASFNAAQAARRAKPKPKPKPAPGPADTDPMLSPAYRAAAAQRAAAIRNQMAREAQRRVNRIAARRAALIRSGKVQDILSAQVGDRGAGFDDPAMRIALHRRQREAAQAQTRHAAYQRLAAVNQGYLAKMTREVVAQADESQRQRAAQLHRQTDLRFAPGGGGFLEGVESMQGVHLVPTPGRLRRDRMVQRARQTGEWQDIVDLIDKDSKDTGGRYVDQTMLNTVMTELVAPVNQIGNNFNRLSTEISDAINSGDIDKARRIWHSAAYQRLQDQYLKWFGDPFEGTEGAMEPIYDRLRDIDNRRQQLILAMRAGVSPSSSMETIRAALAAKARRRQDAVQRQREDDIQNMTAMERGYTTLDDGTIIPYKGRTQGDYATHWNAYYQRQRDELNARQREEIVAAQEYQRRIAKGLRMEGMTNIRFDEDGAPQYDDPEARLWSTRFLSIDPNGVAKRDQLLALRFSNPYQYEVQLHDYMRWLENKWKEKNPEPATPSGGVRGVSTRSPVYNELYAGHAAWNQTRQRFLDETFTQFAGRTYGAMDSNFGNPLGDVLDEVMTYWSIPGAIVRAFGQQGLGSDYAPYVNVDVTGKGGGAQWMVDEEGRRWKYAGPGVTGSLIEFGRVYDKNKDHAWDLLLQAFASGDQQEVGFAIREYSTWGEGNVGWALTQLVDPLQFASLGLGMARPARLAFARAGGLAGLFPNGLGRMGEGALSRMLRNFAELARPARSAKPFGRGSGRVAREVVESRNREWARLRIAQTLEIEYSKLLTKTDAEWDELVQEYVAKKADRTLSQNASNFLNSSALKDNPDQFMARAQSVMGKIAREYKLIPTDAVRIAREMEGIEDALRVAERTALDIQEEAGLRVLRKEAAAATAAMRKGHPTAMAQPAARKFGVKRQQEHLRLLTQYESAAAKYVTHTRRAREILDEMRAVGIAAKTSTEVEGKKLHTLRLELRENIRQISNLRDKTLHIGNPNGLGPTVVRQKEGLVTKTWRELQEYRTSIGGDPDAPSFSALKESQIRKDHAYLVQHERSLNAALRNKSLPPAARAALEKERTLTQKALQGVKFERMARNQRKVAQAAMKAEPGRVDGAVHRRLLGGLGTNPYEQVRETARSIVSKISGAEVAKLRKVNKVEREFVDEVSPRLRRIDASKVVADAGYPELGKVNLLQALQMTEKLSLQSNALAVEFAPLVKKLVRRANKEMSVTGKGFDLTKLKGVTDITDVLDILRFDHARRSNVFFTLDEFEALDQIVAAALRKARGRRADPALIRQAKGAPPKQYIESSSAILFRSDTNPLDVITKIRVLEEQGLDLWHYDALRYSMADTMRKRWSMRSILEEAEPLAKLTGRDIEEVYNEIWDRRAKTESRREFEEFSTRPEFQGYTPRQLLSAFEEEYMQRAQGRTTFQLTEYQLDNLKRAYQAEALHPYDNKAARWQYMSGEPRTAPGTVNVMGSTFSKPLADMLGPGGFVRRVLDPAFFDDIFEDPTSALFRKRRDDIPFDRKLENLDELIPVEGTTDKITAQRLEEIDNMSKASPVRTSGRFDQIINMSKGVPISAEGEAASFTRRLYTAMELPGPRGKRFRDDLRAMYRLVSDPDNPLMLDRAVRRKIADAVDFLDSPKGKARYGRKYLGIKVQTGRFKWAEKEYHDLLAVRAGRIEAVRELKARAGIEGEVLLSASEFRALSERADRGPQFLRDWVQEHMLEANLAVRNKPIWVRQSTIEYIERALDKDALRKAQGVTTDTVADTDYLMDAARRAEGDQMPTGKGRVARRNVEGEIESKISIVKTSDTTSKMVTSKPVGGRLDMTDNFATGAESIQSMISRRHFSYKKKNYRETHPHPGTQREQRQIEEFKADLKYIKELLEEFRGVRRTVDGETHGVFVWFEGSEFGRAGNVLAPGIYVFGDVSEETIAHEVMHAMARMPGNEDLFNEMMPHVQRMGHDQALLNKVGLTGAPGVLGDQNEFLAELYAVWLVNQKRWGEIYAGMDETGQTAMDYLFSQFQYLNRPIQESFGYGGRVPPFGNRTAMTKWLVKHGYWSPRLGDEIARGARTWSIDDERKFFEDNWGYTPPWTDPVILKPLLNNQAALEIAFKSWGMMDSGFEKLSNGLNLNARQLQGQVAWGGEGVARQRTLAEIRRYTIERYGKLVSSNGRTLDRMPWLMTSEDEYGRWMRNTLDEGKRKGNEAALEEWKAAEALLPEPLRKALAEGDTLKKHGLDYTRGLLKEEEIDAFNIALEHAIRKRFRRMMEMAGDPDPRQFLPEEQVRFAYEVTNELMADRAWKYIVKGDLPATAWNFAKLAPRSLVENWGQMWRTLVSFQPAFAAMNLIDSFGFKRVYLQVAENGFTPLGWDDDGRRLIQNLAEAGLETRSLFGLKQGASSFPEIITRVGDKDLSWNVRGGAAVQFVTHAPILVSKFGEDRLRLQFAQSVAGRTYKASLRSGMTVEQAENFARAEARRLGGKYFASAPEDGIWALMDNLVPFFTYNVRNKVIALKVTMDHPQIFAWGSRIADQIEEHNRNVFAEEYPGEEFPSDRLSNRWFWFKFGDDIYQVDLTNFSDWTRGLYSLTNNQDAIDWWTDFIRVPHPSQLGALAILTGGETPWGKPGHIREMSIWIDLLYWMNKKWPDSDYTDPDDQRDIMQMVSQMLFFKKFGKILPVKIKQQTYFAMKDAGDDEAARAYLKANQDLREYWALHDSDFEADPFAKPRPFDRLTQPEKDILSVTMDQFDALKTQLGEDLLQYARRPWSQEYKDAKARSRDMIASFLNQHPELTDFWSMYMGPSEFAAMNDSWKVDEELERFFSMKPPNREKFRTDLAYEQARVAYYERRRLYLDAHPAARDQLYTARTAIEQSWRNTELMWSEILEAQARLKVNILEEEQRGASADREMISVLYEIRSDLSLALDNERYGIFDRDAQNKRLPLEQRLQRMPGFGTIIRAGMNAKQRKEADANLRYARGISEVVKNSTDGKTFYDNLRKTPWLLREYWARNPDAKARFEAGAEYVRQIGTWAQALERNDFVGAQAIWNNLPAWVKERYFEAHPDSGMRDNVVGGAGSTTAVQYKGQWFKSTDSRDRYIYFIEQGGEGPVPKGLDLSAGPTTFSSPEARMRFVRGQEYYATIGGWVELLKKKEYDAADKYFKQMPSWMQEKYFSTHPADRARFQLDSEMLRAGAEYFLAKGDDKARILAKYPALGRWLKEHGGKEAEFSGLINAIYRAIPTSEAWLKRTFRERYPEIFSQEAAGKRRLESVAADLAENPEVYPFYKRAVMLQYKLYQEQLKRDETPPKPWSIERKKRAKERRRRRAARMHSLWSLHRDTRRGSNTSIDRLPRP